LNVASVFPNWAGQVVAILAGGPSAPELAEQLRGRCRIIAVNLAFRLVPEADVLYGADSSFWAHYRDSHDFKGLKLSATPYTDKIVAGLQLVTIKKVDGHSVEGIVEGPIGTIGNGGGNGAFQAMNLAVQFGASKVLLAGVDFTGAHWHRDHPTQLRNPTPAQLDRWRERMDREAPVLREIGVRVINLSKHSSLRAYPHESADSHLPY
jgi:hypothetical protein